MSELERKIALIGYARAALYVLMGIAGFVTLWAGIKHAGKAPVMPGWALALPCLLPFALWGVGEHLGHLNGKHVRQLLEEKEKNRQ